MSLPVKERPWSVEQKVEIHGIRILEMNLPHVRMEVDCSKGTYIRTLCHEALERNFGWAAAGKNLSVRKSAVS